MACQCNHHHYKTTSVALVGGVLKLTINVNGTFRNHEKVWVNISQAIPPVTCPVPVQLIINNLAFTILKPNGSYVLSNRVRTCKTYELIVATDSHIAIANCFNLERVCCNEEPTINFATASLCEQEEICD